MPCRTPCLSPSAWTAGRVGSMVCIRPRRCRKCFLASDEARASGFPPRGECRTNVSPGSSVGSRAHTLEEGIDEHLVYTCCLGVEACLSAGHGSPAVHARPCARGGRGTHQSP